MSAILRSDIEGSEADSIILFLSHIEKVLKQGYAVLSLGQRENVVKGGSISPFLHQIEKVLKGGYDSLSLDQIENVLKGATSGYPYVR